MQLKCRFYIPVVNSPKLLGGYEIKFRRTGVVANVIGQVSYYVPKEAGNYRT